VRVRGRSSSGEKENIMALNTSLIAIIARKYPQIWEIVGGGPAGPGGPGVIRSRIDAVALNPQPLPPAFRYGAAVAHQVVQTAATAHMLKIAFEPGDDICPPPRHWPPIPFPWPPEPDPHPWRIADDEFDVDYALGLAFALEASANAWGRLDGADALERLHDVAVKTAMGSERG
jgi:hypothetical protein